MVNQALLASGSTEWATPFWLFDALNARFQFTLDPCATAENATCPRYFTREQDGLKQPWAGERIFMNPPYGSAIAAWVAKARIEAHCGALVVGLLPARTDTKWWRTHVKASADVYFIAGRLKFGGAQNSAPFPSAIAVWTGLHFLYEPRGRHG